MWFLFHIILFYILKEKSTLKNLHINCDKDHMIFSGIQYLFYNEIMTTVNIIYNYLPYFLFGYKCPKLQAMLSDNCNLR